MRRKSFIGLVVGVMVMLGSLAPAENRIGKYQPPQAGNPADGWFDQGVAADKEGDHVRAVTLYRKAAEKGLAIAQFNLAGAYASGEGVAQNYAEAARWFRKAADQGDAQSQFNLGVLYSGGQGVPQSLSEAAKWWGKAANQGEPRAQANVGRMCAIGEGVRQNLIAAYMWYSLSANQGYPDGVKGRDILKSKLTTAQIAEAEKLISEWNPKR